MIANFWNNIKMFCGNNHKKPIEFTFREGKDTFYACPHYMAKDKNNPNGHTKDEKQCYNRVAFADALGIVEKLSDKIEKDISKNIIQDYTGYTYKYKFYQVKVAKYNKKGFKIDLEILNKNIL